jgi:hypothetical protein
VRQVLPDPHQDQEFRVKGYATVPVLTPGQITELLAEVAQLRPDGDFTPAAGAPMHFSVADTNMEYKRAVQDLLRRVFEPHIKRSLVGFRFLHGIFVVKPPQSDGLGLHADWSVTRDRRDVTAILWCPLTDVGPHTIGVVPGSHKLVPHIEIPRTAGYSAPFNNALAARTQRIPVRAGEAAIFDSSLLHCSVPNDTPQARIALQLTCIPIDATPAFFFKADDSRFELIRAESDFWIEESLDDVSARRPHWESLGFVGNPNRPISETEFMALLDSGDRTSLWDGDPASSAPEQQRRIWPRGGRFGRARAKQR